MATKNVFVLNCVAWQYNDETYYTTEDDAGHPQRVFRSEKKAQHECDRLNVECMVNGDNLKEHCWEGSDQIDIEKLTQLITKLKGTVMEDDYSCSISVPGNTIPEKHWPDLFECVQMSWYNVSEVEMDLADIDV